MRKLDVALVVLLAGCVALNLRLRPDPTQRNRMIFRDMVYPKGFETYTENPFLPGGTTLQQPVPGTVQWSPSPARAGEGGAAVAGAQPGPAHSAALARGRGLYAAFCTVCHGADGAGNGPVVQRGYPAPPSLLAGNATTMTDDQILQVMTAGRNNMPGYAAQIWREDRWKVVLYLRSLQKAAATQPATEPAPAAAHPPEPGS
jgi:mono/diheme cytochrome c family protein